MMSNYTPVDKWNVSGPSSGKNQNDDGGDYAIYYMEGGEAQIFVECIHKTDKNTYQPAEANAHHIVKCVNCHNDLLAALTTLVNIMETEDGYSATHCDCDPSVGIMTCSYCEARAAIKKATE